MGFVICSVTASQYTAKLQNYVIPKLLLQNALNGIAWRQDGALPHKAKSVRRTPFWWQHHLTDFSFSVASAIPRSDSQGFLVLGIDQMQSLHVQSANFIGFKNSIKYEIANIPHVSCCVQLYCPLSPASNG